MCGIVGYVGEKQASSILTEGLAKLEYRGYDSAGIAVINHGVHLRRAVGKLQALKDSLSDVPVEGQTGIGHTRWATHGEPSETNSHPHRDATDTVFVAHNGIFENYAEIRAELEAQGVVFRSQTDTEILPNLVKLAYDANGGDLPLAVRQSLAKVRGAYAVAVLHKDQPEMLVAARMTSPLVVGLGRGENVIASDVPALLGVTRRVIFLDDGEMAVLTPEKVDVYDLDDGKVRRKSVETVDWSLEQAEKGGYKHFMLKEIHEQPEVINKVLARYTDPERTQISLDQIGLTAEELKGIRRIFIQACGTSWHAGLIGKLLIERLGFISVDIDFSSEFRYRNVAPHASGAILSQDTLVIAISQSGETVDTLAGIKEARSRGLKVISVVNVPGSTIARESDGVIYTNAGPEISVASTKAYTAQIAALYLFSLHLGQIHGLIDAERLQRRLQRLAEIPELMSRVLADDSHIQAVAETFQHTEHALFIGRGFGYPSSLEGALKLKEISYIHAEGYSAGELKHGPLALIDDKMPVVCVAMQSQGVVYEKMLSNMQEVRARKGKLIAIASEQDEEIAKYADQVIRVPEVTESYTPFIVALPMQLLAYYVSVLRGLDVDQPRNLAKSVTVE